MQSSVTPVNGLAVGGRPWLWGTKCADAKCLRWSPWTKCGSHAQSGGTIHGSRTQSGGTIGSVTGPATNARPIDYTIDGEFLQSTYIAYQCGKND